MAWLDNLVAQWKLDESSGNPVDSGGNNNTLVNHNSVPFVAGKVNNGADLEAGSSHYFSIADASQTGLDLTGDCSFSFWVKMESQPAGGDPVFSILRKWNEQSNQRSYSIAYLSSGAVMRLQLAISDDGAAETVTDIHYANVILDNGVWNHISITFDASEHKTSFYVNAVFLGISIGNMGYTSIFNGTADFIIGTYINSNYPNGIEFLDGIIDEVMIWSRVLTASEIRTYFNSIYFPSGFAMPTFFQV
jgi:hypothetical protein